MIWASDQIFVEIEDVDHPEIVVVVATPIGDL